MAKSPTRAARKVSLSLTERQVRLIYWALFSGRDQYSKFLLHDGWDAGMTKKERYRELQTDRDFLKAIKVFHNAYERSKKNK